MTPYTLTPSAIDRGESCLVIDLLDPKGQETRGALLARAVGGRYAPGSRCFYFTPARVRKWELLYKTGFSARAGMLRGEYRWKFNHPGAPGGFTQTQAIIAAKVAVATNLENQQSQ